MNELNRGDFWILVAIGRHEVRQHWVGRQVVRRLGGDLKRIARLGYGGHPDGPKEGRVVGLPEWTYEFHGRGCELSNTSRECFIDVDFSDSGGC